MHAVEDPPASDDQVRHGQILAQLHRELTKRSECVNKDGLPEIAEKLYRHFKRTVGSAQFDEKQSIGKRYARMDEAGTPFCVTVDGQSKQDQSATVRDRDTGDQVRIALDQVNGYIAERVGGRK